MVVKVILGVVCVGLILAMTLGNRKVRLLSLLYEQLHVFTNNKKKSLSIWDLTCFIVFPIVIGVILSFGLNCIIDDELAGVFTTFFSIVFTILFGFASILGAKLDNSKGIENKVARETFVSLMTCQLLAIIATVLSICIIKAEGELLIKVLSVFIWSFALMMLMLVLMATKRTYKLYFVKRDPDVKE